MQEHCAARPADPWRSRGADLPVSGWLGPYHLHHPDLIGLRGKAGRGNLLTGLLQTPDKSKDALGRLSYVISEMFLSRFEALMLLPTKAYPLIDSVWAVGCPDFGCCACKKSINQLSM